MQTSEVLNRAADLIEERGWTTGSKGWAYKPNDPLCLEGGLIAASGMTWDDLDPAEFYQCPAYLAVEDYLDLREGREFREAWQWNDAEHRTASEVVEVLRACAVIEASREREAVSQPTGYDAPVVGVSS